MFEIGIAIGIFSYLIFFLGLAGLLYVPLIVVVTIFFWVGFIVWKRKELAQTVLSFFAKHKEPWVLLGITFLVLQALINSIGLLGPEIGFDATWYHLTLPKLYLAYHAIFHIPGTVLYYSDMPKLTEMLYTAGLAFGSDFFARSIHFTFGLLTCIALYKIGRKFFSPSWAIVLPVIFYSSLVVGWESVSAYIDLTRSFFTALALLAFFDWIESRDKKYFVYTALFVGLSVTTKTLALPDIAVYVVAFWLLRKGMSTPVFLKQVLIFIGIAILCPLPWFVFAYTHTGNPLYPIFSSVLPLAGYSYWQLINPLYLVGSLWNTFGRAADPIHPIFLAMLPFFFIYWKKMVQETRILVVLTIGGLLSWYIVPQTGGGRYVLPYLATLSVLVVFILTQLPLFWKRIFIAFIIIVAGISLGYRGIANAKVLPVLSHKETKSQYMQAHLAFSLGDFYDTDNYFATHIKPSDVVLLYGFHNLYYVDFPYIDSAWARKGDWFDYVAVQGNGIPARFKYWELVYFNPITHVRLYNLKGQMWRY